MTVYVIQQDNARDYHKARKWGDFEVLFTRGCFPDNHVERTAEMVEIARAKLRTFDPAKDVLLLNGDPVGITTVSAVLSERWASIPVLKWDKETNDYYKIIIELEANKIGA